MPFARNNGWEEEAALSKRLEGGNVTQREKRKLPWCVCVGGALCERLGKGSLSPGPSGETDCQGEPCLCCPKPWFPTLSGMFFLSRKSLVGILTPRPHPALSLLVDLGSRHVCP